jgi:hypothetical protein
MGGLLASDESATVEMTARLVIPRQRCEARTVADGVPATRVSWLWSGFLTCEAQPK